MASGIAQKFVLGPVLLSAFISDNMSVPLGEVLEARAHAGLIDRLVAMEAAESGQMTRVKTNGLTPSVNPYQCMEHKE